MGTPSIRVGATVLMMVLAASSAGAEEWKPAPLIISRHVIQQGIASAQQGMAPAQRSFAEARQSAGSASTGRRVLWTAIGAVGGFFAGAYLGSAIENAVAPCGCDDPGLKGALIGMPIGALAGGVTGFVVSK
jgi:hypothetical protein